MEPHFYHKHKRFNLKIKFKYYEKTRGTNVACAIQIDFLIIFTIDYIRQYRTLFQHYIN